MSMGGCVAKHHARRMSQQAAEHRGAEQGAAVDALQSTVQAHEARLRELHDVTQAHEARLTELHDVTQAHEARLTEVHDVTQAHEAHALQRALLATELQAQAARIAELQATTLELRATMEAQQTLHSSYHALESAIRSALLRYLDLRYPDSKPPSLASADGCWAERIP
jgi:predicted RNase H-like nuclease (RuvC/YqgF family)